MQSFKELFTEAEMLFTKKELESMIKKYTKEDFEIIAFGRYGNEYSFDVVFYLDSLKEAKNFNEYDLSKYLNKEIKKSTGLNMNINRKSKTYNNGVYIESADWRKTNPGDPHNKYIAFKGK